MGNKNWKERTGDLNLKQYLRHSIAIVPHGSIIMQSKP